MDAQSIQKQIVWQKTVKITSVVSFYFIISLALVFANKIVMNDKFPFPLFATWVQLLVAEVLIILTGYLSPRFSLFSFAAPLQWNWNVALQIIPLTFVYIGMISFNNVCLRYVEVTFYQVARSLTILWTVGFTWTFFPDKPIPLKAIVACIVVFSGFVVGSLGEVNFEWKGLIAGVVSSAFVAYYGIAIKRSLALVGDSTWVLLLYNTTISIFLFIPVLFITGEMIILDPDTSIHPTNEIWNGLVISGLLGYLINIAIFLQINYTSPLTGAISGTAKACVQTLLGWLFFRNEVSLLNFLGICTVIIGSTWYSQIKWVAMKTDAQTDNKHDEENPDKK